MNYRPSAVSVPIGTASKGLIRMQDALAAIGRPRPRVAPNARPWRAPLPGYDDASRVPGNAVDI
jgi:hypothetical protein